MSEFSVLGVSFDGVAISGIVNEFLNVASILHERGFRVLLDLGFDAFLLPRAEKDEETLPSWVTVSRIAGDVLPSDYSRERLEEAFDLVISGISIASVTYYERLCAELADRMVAMMTSNRVRILVVENGTLPNSPLFTEALYHAIARYGAQEQLGKFVLWRDHDLMWSAEPHLFGAYPYAGVRKPHTNEHIEYAVLTDWMRKRVEAWASGTRCHVFPNRFLFAEPVRQPSRRLRESYEIPHDALLIARCTRVVPQKSIERDLWLIAELQKRLLRPLFLFVTGPTAEEPEEFVRLCALASELSITDRVIWGNGLLPFHVDALHPMRNDNQWSIRDLLREADLSSFLTTYDYEGFGNPPGEAMAMSVPFIATTYELYDEVYGNKGVVAPLLPITRATPPNAQLPDNFIQWTIRALTDAVYRDKLTARNYDICKRHFSLSALDRQLGEIFDLNALAFR